MAEDKNTSHLHIVRLLSLLTGHIHLGSRGAAPLFILLLTKTQLSAARVLSDLFKKCRISIISSLVLALPIYLSWKSRS